MKKLFVLFFLFCFSFSFSQKKALLTTWIVMELNEQSLDTNYLSQPCLTFDKHKVTGNTSCNRFFGNYKIHCKRLTFDEVASTKMLCPEPINAIERNFLQALSEVYYWKIKEKKLYFLDEKSNCIMKLKEK